MAVFKRKTLLLSSGRQIKMYGSSIAISRTLEIGEGYAPNILSLPLDGNGDQEAVMNPHRLSAEDVVEVAHLNIRLWLELVENIRKYGLNSVKIFHADSKPNEG